MHRLRAIFVRHGESANNVLALRGAEYFAANRVEDPALTERGMQQAACVAKFFASSPALLTPIDEIIVSPMLRTLMTADPIARTCSMAPTVWADVYETGGCFRASEGKPGLSPQQIRDAFPTYHFVVGQYGLRDDGWYETGLGEEPAARSEMRARTVFQRLKDKAAALKHDVTILLVIHHDFIDLLLRQASGGFPSAADAPPGAFYQHYNCALSAVDVYSDGRAQILFTNRHEFIDDSLVRKQHLGAV
jgi:broad specificity phosphatase PhoE